MRGGPGDIESTDAEGAISAGRNETVSDFSTNSSDYGLEEGKSSA